MDQQAELVTKPLMFFQQHLLLYLVQYESPSSHSKAAALSEQSRKCKIASSYADDRIKDQAYLLRSQNSQSFCQLSKRNETKGSYW